MYMHPLPQGSVSAFDRLPPGHGRLRFRHHQFRQTAQRALHHLVLRWGGPLCRGAPLFTSSNLIPVNIMIKDRSFFTPSPQEMKARNISTVTPNGQPRFYMTQVVPSPANTSLQLVDDFHTALNRIPLPANYARSRAYVAFEGRSLVSSPRARSSLGS